MFEKGVCEAYSFSGKRTNRDVYVTKEGIKINADINGALNIMRKKFSDLCKDIKIESVLELETLGFEDFYPPYIKHDAA